MGKPPSKAFRPGARLGSYRSGDRSEYLAAYVLSRVAYVNSIPRQEDFGVVDYFCVLARTKSKYVYPEGAFYVQVKSDAKPYTLSDVAFNWLTEHMEHPLFICVVDKEQSRISFYSCIHLWHAVFGFWAERRSIKIKFGGVPGEESNDQHHGRHRYTINLGRPILRRTIQEIESDPETAYLVLRDWITLDAANIARRRMGRVAVTIPVTWEPNVAPFAHSACDVRTHYFFGRDYYLVERELAPILTALAHNYLNARKDAELTALCGFLDKIRKFLDPHGLEFADGKLTVE